MSDAVHGAIARRLRRHGVDTLFGVMGDGNMLVVESFRREEGGRYLAVAHEANAVLAALGWARVRGGPGVATVTHGPGLGNTVTALVEGVRGRIPALVLVGATARDDPGHFQRIEQEVLVAATGAGFRRVHDAASWAAALDGAFRAAREERRPIVLEIPVELMEARAAPAPPMPEPAASAPAAAEEGDLDAALGMLLAARRPLVLAGRGAASADARAALVRLAELLGAPLMTTLGAKDLFRGLPADRGVFGGLADAAGSSAMAGADAIAIFGASRSDFTTGRGAHLAGRAVIVCDTEPGERQLGDRLLRADAASTAAAMVRLLEEADGASARPWAPPPPDPESPATPIGRAVAAFEDAFPADRIVVTDAGRFMGAVWRGMHVRHPVDLVPTMHFGAIGCGTGYAIGVAAAAPDRRVVLAVGDGGLMLGGVAELGTLARHGLRVTVLVLDDRAYGAEYAHLAATGRDPDGARIAWPDLDRVAVAMGVPAARVAIGEDAGTAAQAAAAAAGPMLVDVLLDPAHVPPIH